MVLEGDPWSCSLENGRDRKEDTSTIRRVLAISLNSQSSPLLHRSIVTNVDTILLLIAILNTSAGFLPVSNPNDVPCDLGQGLTGWELRADDIGNDQDPSTTHPNNTTGATTAAKAAEATNCGVAAIAMHDTDADDATDIIDADIYEQISQNTDHIPAYPEQGHSIETVPPAQPQPVKSESHAPPMPPILPEGNSPKLVVECFLYGSAGVPLPGVHQGLSLYQTSLEALGQSTWAPFQSQSDWELAHWATMCGPTSSAVADLLAIPQYNVSTHSTVIQSLHVTWSSHQSAITPDMIGLVGSIVTCTPVTGGGQYRHPLKPISQEQQ
ncbi:hypothetical protein EDB92DRAFT_1820591 [Lactarius akahatsu]|uniref:Uncharacterized protein n=1 Tax=Lactarius akahatsu TaxID=416441 RepID=A0AAD4L7S8_9AGAM|nr:hypothetical protein EDB92DRAFT_1820591 [Lactarius akahatsu]